jgi:hypothetical protein
MGHDVVSSLAIRSPNNEVQAICLQVGRTKSQVLSMEKSLLRMKFPVVDRFLKGDLYGRQPAVNPPFPNPLASGRVTRGKQ